MQMTQVTFGGLVVQPNSLNVPQGSFEVLENTLNVQDNIIQKRRGFDASFLRPPTGKTIYGLLEKGSDFFFVTEDGVYAIVEFTALASTTALSSSLTITSTNHGLLVGSFISSLASTSFTLNSAFPLKYATLSGTFAIVSTPTANTFLITLSEAATATVTSQAVTFLGYRLVTGTDILEQSPVKAVSANKNVYFTSSLGVKKLESSTRVFDVGVAGYLDGQAYGAVDTNSQPAEVLFPNSQVEYRCVFGRTDAGGNKVVGAPSQRVAVTSPLLSPTSFSLGAGTYGATTVRVTYAGHGLATGAQIQVFNDFITPVAADFTQYSVTVISSSVFDIDWGVAPSLGSPPSGSPQFQFSTYQTVTIDFTIPSTQLSLDCFVQFYRTSNVQPYTNETLGDFRLLVERNLTAAEVTQGFCQLIDTTPEFLLAQSPELYTNNNSQEGESQANSRPPQARSLAVYQNFLFYAFTTDYQRLNFQLLSTANLANLDTVSIGTEVYEFRFAGTTNGHVGNEKVTQSGSVSAGTLTVSTPVDSALVVGDQILVSATTISGAPSTPFSVTILTKNASQWTASIASGSGSGTVTYEGVVAASGNRIVKLYKDALLVSLSVTQTAGFLQKAINRNALGDFFCIDVSDNNTVPGALSLESKTTSQGATSFTGSTSLVNNSFLPVLGSASATTSQDIKQNQLAVSKVSEPEAVPLLNTLLVGSAETAILGIAALRDSLIILKEDGIYRLNGLLFSNFIIVPLDTTVFCKAEFSIATLNNSVYCLSNQGMVQISDSSVRIISRQIDPLLSDVLGRTDLSENTRAVSYESNRLYILSTLDREDAVNSPTVTYVYNYLSDNISTWTGTNFYTARNRIKDDKLYMVDTSRSSLWKERKNLDRIDFAEAITNVAVWNQQIATCQSVAGSNVVFVTTLRDHGLSVGDSLTVYETTPLFASGFGGEANLTSGRIVASTPSMTTFTFLADTNSSGSLISNLKYNFGITDQKWVAQSTSGSISFTLTSPVPHGLSTGNFLFVSDGTFPNAFGTRQIIVTSPTQVVISGSSPSGFTATGSLYVTDKRLSQRFATVLFPSGIEPLVSDGLYSDLTQGKLLNFMLTLTQFGATQYYLVEFENEITFHSKDLVRYGRGIASRLDFAPMAFGDVGQLKNFTYFQSTFRNQSCCTRFLVDAGTDSVFSSSDPQTWLAIDTDLPGLAAPLLGFGFYPWGSQPFGSTGQSVSRSVRTEPSLITRTVFPSDGSRGVFLLLKLFHIQAFEDISMQSLSIFYSIQSERTTP